MPILLVLLVAAACLQLPWPEPPVGSAGDPRSRAAAAAALTAAVMAVPLLSAAALSGWVVWALKRDPFNRPVVGRFYGKNRRRLGYANLLGAAVAVAGCGWGWAVWNGFPELTVTPFGTAGRPVLCPGAELLVPAPYFLAVILGWVIYYPAERALHDTSPAVITSANPPAFWTFPGYLLFHGRQFLLLVSLPASLFAAQQGAIRALPAWAAAGWLQLGWAVVMAALLVLMPLAVKPLLGLVSLPPGRIRDRLEATARRLGFRCADFLLWPTRGGVANAMVLGVVPWARYVVFTDRLLDALDPDELDAVLGHEAGHVRHGHIPYYAGFLVVSALTATTAVVAAERALRDAGLTLTDGAGGWEALASVLLLAVYLFLVFGLLSRRCERQADVFGCRAGSCGNPRCTGHDEKTRLVPAGRGLCPTGARALIQALGRVDVLNGADGVPSGRQNLRERLAAIVRAWQHGPIPDRIEFLYAVADDPALGDRTDRRVNRFRWGLAAVLLAAMAWLGSSIGWDELWRML